MRVRVLLALALGACASPAPPTPIASAPAVSSSAAAPLPSKPAACRKRDADEARMLEQIVDGLRQPEMGGHQKDHAEFFRFLPTLHETGVMTSIAAVHAKDGENPIFAVVLLVRNAKGTMDANLGFAAMPCPDGDLALIGPLVPLSVASARIRWIRQVPALAEPLTELEVEVSDAPAAGIGQPPPVTRWRSIVVGPKPDAKIGVIGVVDKLEVELPPTKEGLHRADTHISGSGWYAHRGGASYLWVHRESYDRTELCNHKKKERPLSLPMLRLLAHIDPKLAFTTDAASVGMGFVIGVGEHPPPEGMFEDKASTARYGPTAIQYDYDHGPPVQTIYGIFESVDAAKARAAALKYTKGNFYSTEPPPGVGAAKEPWTITLKVSPKILRIGCDDYM